MSTSPNVDNLTLHGGIVYFQPGGVGDFVDLGECDAFVLALADDTKLEYKSKRAGTRRTVKTVITDASASINFTLMEITGKNLALAVGGTPTVQTDGRKRIGVKTDLSTTGVLRIVGTNITDGNACEWEGTVDIFPNGEVDFLSDEFMQLAMVAEIQADAQGAFGYVTVDDNEATL
jgi:hypothetical protein